MTLFSITKTDAVTIYPFKQAINTVLLLHMNGTNGSPSFPDSSIENQPVTSNGGASIDTTITDAFGGAAGTGKFVAASSQYLSTPDSADWFFGTGDFTIDFWLRLKSLPSASFGQWNFISQHDDSSNRQVVYIINNHGTIAIRYFVVSGGSVIISTGELNTNPNLAIDTWYHFALIRNGTSFTWYENGTSIGSVTDSDAVPNFPAPFIIGGEGAGLYLDGWVDEFRISKGVARWTSNFTPPTAPYTAEAGFIVLQTKKMLKEISRIGDVLAPRNKIRFIQSATASGSGLSMTVTLPNLPTKGNGIILTVGVDSALLQTVSSITSAGATWLQAVASISGVLDGEIWYATDLQGVPGAVITINFSGVTLEAHATAREYKGLEDINILDRVIDNSGTSSNPDTGTTPLTTVANELWVGNTTTLSLTNQSAPTDGFILIDGVAGAIISNAYLEKFTGTKGQAHSSTTSGNATWVGCMATFKAPTILEIFVSEAIAIMERISKTTSKRLLEIVRIAEAAVVTKVSGVKQIIVTDMLRINDYARRTVAKRFTDTPRIADAVRTFHTFGLRFTDAIRILDRTVKTTSKTVREAIRINDFRTFVVTKGLREPFSIAERTTKNIFKRFSDAARIFDTTSMHKTMTRTFTDAIRIAERSTRNIAKRLTEPLAITDYVKTFKTRFLVFLEALTIRERQVVKSVSKRLTDQVAIAESLVKNVTKKFSDAVRISEAVVTKQFHLFHIIVTDVVRILDLPIGSFVVVIHQIVGAVRKGLRSIGAALENQLHPSEKQKDSVGQADS